MRQAQGDINKERLLDEFNSVIAETEQLLKSVANAGSDKAGNFKAGIEEGLAAAGERLAQIREESMKQAGAAARATDEYVHDNPWRVIGVAAGVGVLAGLVAGLLIARR